MISTWVEATPSADLTLDREVTAARQATAASQPTAVSQPTAMQFNFGPNVWLVKNTTMQSTPVPLERDPPEASNAWDVEVFFDGDCPLCRREINWLRKRDMNSKVRFTDIAAAGFDPTDFGQTQDELMARIHGRLPNGQLIEGVEVFRRLYSAVGMAWLVAPTRLPVIRGLLDFGYRIFARYRLRLTGRCSTGECSVELPRSGK